jgi:sugar/nucleoside kinase (ribokinase family)
MVAVEATERRVLLYRSDDLKTWTFLSDYGPAGAVGGVWECPDLFPLAVDGDPDDVRWVLLISLNPGGLAGGSGTQYVVGRFDGVRFIPDERRLPVRASGLDDLDWIDHGRDCYAGVTFHGLPDDDRILIAWMSNWDYARGLRPAPWQGAMTTARRLGLTLRTGRAELTSRPVLPAGQPVEIDPSAAVILPAAARIDVRVRGEVLLEFDTPGGPGVVLRCGTDEIVLDRREVSGVHAEFPSIERMRLPRHSEDVRILVDTTSIEVFAADGLRTITDIVPWSGEVTLRVRRHDGLERLAVTDLSAASGSAPILVIGESLIDVVDRAGDQTRHVGGSPLNVAYGLGRLGIPTVFATEFGDDPDGVAIAGHLGAVGVTVAQTSVGGRTGVAIARLGDAGAAEYEFDLDWRFDGEPAVPQPGAVHVGSIGALRSPGGEGVLAFVERLPRDVLVSFDPNIRPAVVPPRPHTRRLVERYAARATVVKLSDEDARWLYPGEEDAVAARLLACGARLVAITRGTDGSDLYTRSAHVHIPAEPAHAVDTIGAGDAYTTGLLSAIVTGVGAPAVRDDALTPADLAQIGRVAAVAAAVTVGRAGAVPPTATELQRALAEPAVAG